MEKNKNKEIPTKWTGMYCDGITRSTNLEKEHAVVIFVLVFAIMVIFGSSLAISRMDEEDYQFMRDVYKKGDELSEQQIYEEVKSIQETIDTSNWKSYQSQWYGFSLKYPDNYDIPITQSAPINSNWEYRYEFRKKEIGDSSFIGFDVLVYSVEKVKELMNIAEFPTIKDEKLKDDPWCKSITGRIIETGDYPAEEIYIPPTDSCYNPTLFFTFTRDNYIYVIAPTVKDGAEISGDPRIEINDNFTEFFGVISTADLIDIKRSKPVSTVRTSIPMPVSYKVVDGRLVCAKKNDHPGKSNQNKSKHLDMECCLDPDEYPNPRCYYSSSKYGKYLN